MRSENTTAHRLGPIVENVQECWHLLPSCNAVELREVLESLPESHKTTHAMTKLAWWRVERLRRRRLRRGALLGDAVIERQARIDETDDRALADAAHGGSRVAKQDRCAF